MKIEGKKFIGNIAEIHKKVGAIAAVVGVLIESAPTIAYGMLSYLVGDWISRSFKAKAV